MIINELYYGTIYKYSDREFITVFVPKLSMLPMGFEPMSRGRRPRMIGLYTKGACS